MSRIGNAIVIGGGIGGPVAAMALQKAGIEATVYEAYEGSADGVGGALSIAPNGRTALAAIGAEERVAAAGSPMRGMVMQSWTGKRLAEFGTPPGLPEMLLVWRSDLYRALYGEAARRGVRVEHGRRLVSLSDEGGRVVAQFADGTSAAADVLIGADGIRSTVRRLIDPAAPEPRYAGLLGFGARTSGEGLTPTADKMHMVFGKRAFFGYQVTDTDSGWFANLPHPRPMSAAEARGIGAAEWLRRLQEVFRDDRTPAVEMIRRTAPEDLVITGGLEDIPSVPTWHRGRVVLLGDAAHATSPSSGQGASLAIESAVQLARCLRDLPVPDAFAAFEGLRRERVERIIRMAEKTNSDKAAGPVARVLRDLIMPVAMRLLASPEKFAWQFDHPIDWAAPVTAPRGVALPT
ncbi:FAD-dependent oxidoreductase [Dactylosporangium darangshiense]|uniref:FAD-dependent monooxygenase n=1 Tax=Dactylosporangium darangshiense TaxID=579108 RepID=A0ABP8DJW1_9ACTN